MTVVIPFCFTFTMVLLCFLTIQSWYSFEVHCVNTMVLLVCTVFLYNAILYHSNAILFCTTVTVCLFTHPCVSIGWWGNDRFSQVTHRAASHRHLPQHVLAPAPKLCYLQIIAGCTWLMLDAVIHACLIVQQTDLIPLQTLACLLLSHIHSHTE